MINANPVPRKTSVYVPSLSKELDMETYNTLKKANIPVEQMKTYDDLFRKKEGFFKRVGKFITATNKAGRRAKIIKDFALIFFPWGKQVADITEFATDVLKPEQTYTDMPETTTTKNKERTAKGATVAFGLLFIAGLLQVLGLDLGLELSPDAGWVSTGAGAVGMILRLVTGNNFSLTSN